MGGSASDRHASASDDADDAGDTDAVAYLDDPFRECLRQVGAIAGAIYLRDSDPGMLRLAVLAGLPLDMLSPWLSAIVSAPLPGTDAYRDQRFVWVGSQEEMAHVYPRVAAVLPYPFALAAVPVTATHRWGVLLLMWPATHPPVASSRERRNINTNAQRLARLIDTRARTRLPLPPRPPRVLTTPTPRLDTVQHGLAAADVLERLPEGACGLDLQGRLTYVSPKAADLLGRSERELLGTLPWHSIPWLDDPAYEDRYRAALVSREPVSFTAVRPGGDSLRFHLHPGGSGITVLISGAHAGHATSPSAAARGAADASPTSAGHLYQVVHVAAALTEAATVRDVADVVAEQVMPVVNAQAALLYTVKDGRLRLVGHTGYPPRLADLLDGAPLDSTFSAAAQASTTGAALFLDSADKIDQLFPRLSQITGKQSWALLPLATHHHPMGGCVFAYDEEHPFDANERAVLISLAGLIAQALDRARLYDDQHRLARGLQQALLPRALPEHPRFDAAARYLPATRGMDIGGDFYDLIQVDDTTVVAVIGDVEGHNVAAATVMGQIRVAIRSHTDAGAPPGHVLMHTSRLLDDLNTDLLASCLIARLDLAANSAQIASAGHLPPLLRLPGHACAPAEIEPGPLLGSTANPRYPLTELALPPGSLLALYTDGLVEGPGIDLEQELGRCAGVFNEDVGKDKPLPALIDRLLEETSQDFPRRDDIAILLLHSHR